jgi:hypothetical protein
MHESIVFSTWRTKMRRSPIATERREVADGLNERDLKAIFDHAPLADFASGPEIDPS